MGDLDAVGQKIKGKVQKAQGRLEQASGRGIKGGITRMKGSVNDTIASARMRRRDTDDAYYDDEI